MLVIAAFAVLPAVFAPVSILCKKKFTTPYSLLNDGVLRNTDSRIQKSLYHAPSSY